MSICCSRRPALAVVASLTLFVAVSSPALLADEALNAKVDAVLAAGQPRTILYHTKSPSNQAAG